MQEIVLVLLLGCFHVLFIASHLTRRMHALEYSALNPHLHVHHLYLYPTTIGPCPESSPLIITVTTRILNYQVKDIFSDLSPKTRSQTPFFQLPLLHT